MICEAPLFISKNFMPFQSGYKFQEFQERKLGPREARRRLFAKAFPGRCYCGAGTGMRVHSWVSRYHVDSAGVTHTLRVPVAVCPECGRHIRILPVECHAHCNHGGEQVGCTLRAWHDNGCRHPSSIPVDPRLRRFWFEGFRRNRENCAMFSGLTFIEALDAASGFAILFHSQYIALPSTGPPFFFPTNQRMLRLTVYQEPP